MFDVTDVLGQMPHGDGLAVGPLILGRVAASEADLREGGREGGRRGGRKGGRATHV